MPRKPNRLLRVLIPVLAIAGGVVVATAFFINSAATKQPAGSAPPAQTPTGQMPQGTGAASAAGEAEAPLVGAPSPTGQPVVEEPRDSTVAGDYPELAGLRARAYRDLPIPAPVGDLEYGVGAKMRMTFTLFGAGVETIVFSDYFESVRDAIRARQDPEAASAHYVLQRRATVQTDGGPVSISSLAARAVVINGSIVDLYSSAGLPVWREAGPGTFEAVIVDANDHEVARIEKRYVLADNTFDIHVLQRLVNLMPHPIEVQWYQYGPLDLVMDMSGYNFDTRRVRFGFLLAPSRDPSRTIVEADRKLTDRKKLGEWAAAQQSIWPDPERYKGADDLVWTAQTNRYFAFAVHPIFDPLSRPDVPRLEPASNEVRPIAINPWRAAVEPIVLQMTGAPVRVAAGGALDLTFGAYAGPLGRRALEGSARPGETDPNGSLYRALQLPRMVQYSIGACAICTFQWLAQFLLTVLLFFHDYITRDWALAIMLLVVCVRGVLHPVFKRSQISLQRFSRQMQGIAPKQKKVQEKFKDDPKRMQQEMIKLMREEGVNYSGALGCLPMFLQSPIWIALYAMLYFAFELRHEPAFYGLFQSISGGGWIFLADLSTADNFIPFGRTLITLPLLGEIRGINILPLLLGFVFYFQQKYLTPPPTTTLTPEQQTQQKIMKVMMVVMFPVFMYNAPSGLSVYFITNSALGILESQWIRRHINQMDLDAKKPAGAAPTRKKIASKSERPNPFKKDRDRAPRFKRRDG